LVKNNYIPERGDIVWVNFTPQSGHEQAGKRPAVVLSPSKYNGKTGLMITCPVTSKVKGYPFEVAVKGKTITGVVLSDQIKSFDWKTRNAQFIEKISEKTLEKVQDKLIVLIQ